ncbi:MAG: transporter [Deltaproteobacteria bacterium]|nr:transporter [Deltaproteobacteria bacterium]
MNAASKTAVEELTRTLRLGNGARWRRIGVRVAVAVIAVAAVVGLAAWWRSAHAPRPVSYRTAVATRGSLSVVVTATGTVQAWNTVDVGSEVSGRIRRILVADNAVVTRGQVLAEIDPEVFDAQLEQARAARALAVAQLTGARATQREARKLVVRDRELFARGVISEQELEAATGAAERADAAVTIALASIRQTSAVERVATTNLTRTTIRSPIDGVVLSHSIEAGQTVVAAFQAPILFRIAEDLRAMKVEIDVDEADVGRVRDGQRARFEVAAYLDHKFEARVTAVHNAARLVDRVVSYQADLAVDNTQLLLRPGMTATAEIIVDEVRDAILVPGQALRFTPTGVGDAPPGVARVWLDAGAPIPVQVTVLGQDETHAAIRIGDLPDGARVVTERQ